MADIDASVGESDLERIAKMVHEEMNDPAVRLLYGQEALSRKEQIERIIWTPVASAIQRPERLSGKDHAGNRERQTFLRIASAAVHIMAHGRARTEQTFKNFLAAFDRALSSSGNATRYNWPSDEEGSGITRRGDEIIVQVQVRMPVRDDIKPLATIAAQEHNCELDT